MSSATNNRLLILVTKEKHGEYHYNVSTIDLRNKTFYKLLKERMEGGWYSTMEDPRVAKPTFNEEIEAIQKVLADDNLPVEIRRNGEDTLTARLAEIEEYEESAYWWKRANKVLSLPEEQGIQYRTKNGSANEAERLLDERFAYEYEGFDFIRVNEL